MERSTWIRGVKIAAMAMGLGVSLLAETFTLVVPAGAPLLLSIDKKVSIRKLGEPVRAHLVHAIFAIDREVIPSGSRVEGEVVRLDPVPVHRRIRSIMSGDLTPFRNPFIVFTRLITPDGRVMTIKTAPMSGNGPVIRPEAAAKPVPKDTFAGRTAEFVRTSFANAREEASMTWRSDDKWDRLEQMGYSYLPYHPQFIPAKTQISVELEHPLAFGTQEIVSIQNGKANFPPIDSIVRARIATPVDSSSRPGTRVEAIVSEPVYSDTGKLLLPEGTKLIGTVLESQEAASWRRGGRLRFSFQWIELPRTVAASRRLYRLDAIVNSVNNPLASPVKVDAEGGTRSVEPLTRFIAPALKMLIGSQMVDEDQQVGGQSQAAKRTWSTLAGASGFGLLGSVAAQLSHDAGTALGFYGLGWSVFTHIVAKGHNVVFLQDTPVMIRLLTEPT